jgi:hypothetical protein
MDEIKFNAVKAMVSWLIDNEGKGLADDYGREWLYSDYKFFFKDIGDTCCMPGRLRCLHLYGTELKIMN